MISLKSELHVFEVSHLFVEQLFRRLSFIGYKCWYVEESGNSRSDRLIRVEHESSVLVFEGKENAFRGFAHRRLRKYRLQRRVVAEISE